MYEIILAFFVVTVIIFAVIAFMYLNVSSSALYAKLKQGSSSQTDAVSLKDELLACHRLDYLDETLMDAPCRAKTMLQGYTITQLPLNGCQAKTWKYAKSDAATSVPFVVDVAQAGSGKKCLARLNVLL
jgi:uncharacterized membrane protein